MVQSGSHLHPLVPHPSGEADDAANPRLSPSFVTSSQLPEFSQPFEPVKSSQMLTQVLSAGPCLPTSAASGNELPVTSVSSTSIHNFDSLPQSSPYHISNTLNVSPFVTMSSNEFSLQALLGSNPVSSNMVSYVATYVSNLFPITDIPKSPSTPSRSLIRYPTLQSFINSLVKRGRIPTIILFMALSLVDRTSGRWSYIPPTDTLPTQYCISFTCLLLACKYCYDDAAKNCYWIKLSSEMFSLQEINAMELHLLQDLEHKVNVRPEEIEAQLRGYLNTRKSATVGLGTSPVLEIFANQSPPVQWAIFARVPKTLARCQSEPTKKHLQTSPLNPYRTSPLRGSQMVKAAHPPFILPHRAFGYISSSSFSHYNVQADSESSGASVLEECTKLQNPSRWWMLSGSVSCPLDLLSNFEARSGNSSYCYYSMHHKKKAASFCQLSSPVVMKLFGPCSV